MEHVEIERKWLIDGFPEGLPLLRESEMEQGYLCFEPVTVRIRKSAEETGAPSYVLAIKGKGLLTRTEVETPLDKSQYDKLKQMLALPAVRKLRRDYQLAGGLVLECSHVDAGQPTAFYYAEVEFESEAAAAAFQPLPCLGAEKTQDPAFTMAAYCKNKNSRP